MKLTKQEKSWILYDVANSAFILLLSTTIPMYFRSLAQADGIAAAEITSIFSLSTSIAVLIVAALAPFLGAIADHQGMKKRLFVGFLFLSIVGGLSLTVITQWQAFLYLLVMARIGYSMCNVFYDSMLTDVTTDERMDAVSGAGFAYGYIGSVIPFIAGLFLVLVQPFDLNVSLAVQISFLITMVWWAVLSIPLLKNVHQTHYKKREGHEFKHVIQQLKGTLKKITQNKSLFFFMLAYFCYIDGVNTIISQSTNFGGEVGIDTNMMIVALLMTQFVAFPFAILSGRLSKRFGSLNMIRFYIGIYTLVCVIAFFLQHAWQFWMLAFLVGLAQGGIQALSRSFFGQLVPKDSSNEYFGFFDIFGKFAEFFGPLMMSASVILFGQSKYGILALVTLFILGLFFLKKSEKQLQS